MSQLIDLTGRRFHRLVVLGRGGSCSGHVKWRCLCDCGNETEVLSQGLRRGRTKSCGCYNIEAIKSRKPSITHGMTHTRIYRIWGGIKTRCLNDRDRAFRNYGARGIRICRRWMRFENFLADMGQPPSDEHEIERIDNNAGYRPDNCKWILPTEQNRNKRNNVWLEHGGRRMILADWARELGLAQASIRHRIAIGMPIEQALSPIRSPGVSFRPRPLRTSCKRGHPYSGLNVGQSSHRGRFCKKCMAMAQARHRSKRRKGSHQ